MVFGIIIGSLLGALVFFGVLYYVVAAAVKKGILDSNFVTAIKMGIQEADAEKNQRTIRKAE